jgi:S-adenosylmethionine hydrolase
MSDFSLKDGAVSAMQGVAKGVSNNLDIYDITHDIEPYNIYEGAYRLYQTAQYWPKGTVFVSIIDPGVGTSRRSIVLETLSGHYFVAPDNGLISLVIKQLGIKEIREIDENKHRLVNSQDSHTFYGRDLYIYVGAKLAAKKINFKEVGVILNSKPVLLNIYEPHIKNNKIYGSIPILDIQYGNIWIDITMNLFSQLNIQDKDLIHGIIKNNDTIIYDENLIKKNTFGEVLKGDPLIFFNSLLHLSLAINQDNFAQKYSIKGGLGWTVEIEKCNT